MNGIPIERTLQKNGKDLSPDETRKQDERVMKETLKYSNQATAKKEEDKQIQEVEDFMEAMMLANGHRERVNGRSMLFYDIVPNPHIRGQKPQPATGAGDAGQGLHRRADGRVDRYQREIRRRFENRRRRPGKCAQGSLAACRTISRSPTVFC